MNGQNGGFGSCGSSVVRRNEKVLKKRSVLLLSATLHQGVGQKPFH